MPLLALLLDLLFGDPPNRFHPTAWMGSLIRWLLRFRPRNNPPAEFIFGIFILLAGLVLSIGAGLALSFLASQLLPLFLMMILRNIPSRSEAEWTKHATLIIYWAGILLQAFALKLTLSLRGLDRAAKEVQSALEIERVSGLRRRDRVGRRKCVRWDHCPVVFLRNWRVTCRVRISLRQHRGLHARLSRCGTGMAWQVPREVRRCVELHPRAADGIIHRVIRSVLRSKPCASLEHHAA